MRTARSVRSIGETRYFRQCSCAVSPAPAGSEAFLVSFHQLDGASFSFSRQRKYMEMNELAKLCPIVIHFILTDVCFMEWNRMYTANTRAKTVYVGSASVLKARVLLLTGRKLFGAHLVLKDVCNTIYAITAIFQADISSTNEMAAPWSGSINDQYRNFEAHRTMHAAISISHSMDSAIYLPNLSRSVNATPRWLRVTLSQAMHRMTTPSISGMSRY